MKNAVVSIQGHKGQLFEVLQETERTQTAVMTIAPGGDSGPEETHAGDQVVYVIEGEAVVTIDGTPHHARAGACAVIPAGARHHVKNPGGAPLFCLTIYAPPAY
jgi:mannose-6-phosphate isomerase-like protein (cupin superfamily)